MMLRFFFISTLLFFASSLLAQQVNISPDKKRIRIGEEIKLTIQAKAPSNKEVVWPNMKDTLGGYFDILKALKLDTISDAGANELVLERRISITSFDSGSHQLPKLLFEFKGSEGIDSVYTDPLSFSILTVPVDTTLAIKDVRDILEVPFEIGEYLPWVLGGIALVAILVAALYFYLNRKKPLKPAASKVVIVPWKKALQELFRIEKEKIWKEGKVKAYYSEVSDTIREYLEDQFKIPALELTSDEILAQLRSRSWSNEVILNVKELLQLSDLVKFAKEKPTEVSHARSLELARDIIANTKPAEPDISSGKEGKHV